MFGKLKKNSAAEPSFASWWDESFLVCCSEKVVGLWLAFEEQPGLPASRSLQGCWTDVHWSPSAALAHIIWGSLKVEELTGEKLDLGRRSHCASGSKRTKSVFAVSKKSVLVSSVRSTWLKTWSLWPIWPFNLESCTLRSLKFLPSHIQIWGQVPGLLATGSWFINSWTSGSWFLVPGSWSLVPGPWIPGPYFLDSWTLVLLVWSLVPGSWFLKLFPVSWTLGSWFLVPEFLVSWFLIPGTFGPWFLWSLVFGTWILVPWFVSPSDMNRWFQ